MANSSGVIGALPARSVELIEMKAVFSVGDWDNSWRETCRFVHPPSHFVAAHSIEIICEEPGRLEFYVVPEKGESVKLAWGGAYLIDFGNQNRGGDVQA